MFQQPTGSDVSVYVVDDDQQSSRAIAELVRSFGHQVKVFDGPRPFLDDLQESGAAHLGVVILDHRMPGMDGLEVCQHLTEQDFTLPVILVSGHAETSLTVRAMRSGALAVLDMPCRENELWSFIQEALAKSAEELRRKAHHQELEERFRRLAPPDRQVLQLILDGCKNRTMAKRLDVSLRTVENRRRRVFEVMHADSVAELTRMVMDFENRLLPSRGEQEAWLSLPFERVA